eukprot:TRINITY_DN12139_c0_g1_i2.p1 TRINITY_DN12139_c0_g1~~TRINITY_DN12139_c0_g1_i2.p1  ORF type:complete len:569 (+),score=119.11 TRINITY_DN12139_c0_g1_i2:63-1769(+)
MAVRWKGLFAAALLCAAAEAGFHSSRTHMPPPPRRPLRPRRPLPAVMRFGPKPVLSKYNAPTGWQWNHHTENGRAEHCRPVRSRQLGNCTPSVKGCDYERLAPQPPAPGRCVTVSASDEQRGPIPGRRAALRARLRQLDVHRIELWYLAAVRWQYTLNMWPTLLHNLAAAGGMLTRIRVICPLGRDTASARVGRRLVEAIVNTTPSEFRSSVTLHDVTLPAVFKGTAYRNMTDPQTLYFKLDDDVLFIRPGSIESMLETFVDHAPNATIVTANVVNGLGLTPVHQYLGAVGLPHSAYALADDSRIWTSMGDIQEWTRNHVTFLERFAGGDISAYDLGTYRFNCGYKSGEVFRFGLNFVLLVPLKENEMDSMLTLKTFNRDEVYFTKVRLERTRRDGYVAGKAIVVHAASVSNRHSLENHLKIRPDPDHSTEGRLPPLAALRWRYAAAQRVGLGETCCEPDCPLLPLLSIEGLLSSRPLVPSGFEGWDLNDTVLPDADVLTRRATRMPKGGAGMVAEPASPRGRRTGGLLPVSLVAVAFIATVVVLLQGHFGNRQQYRPDADAAAGGGS